MLTNLLVPGMANLQWLARSLHELGVLNFFVYSHARRSTPAALGLPEDRALNLWRKEYLVRGHGRILGSRFTDRLFPIYNGIWEREVLLHWRKSRVVHVLLWGAARRVLRRAKSEGAATLGLVGNSHPDQVVRLLSEEAERLGVPQPPNLRRIRHAVLEEIDACDHLQAESEFSRQSYITYGFPAERVHILRGGLVPSRFYPDPDADANEAGHRFRVICVGAISLRKGQAHLLEAWRRLSLPDAELTLIGGISEQVQPIIGRYSGEFTHIPYVPDLRPYYTRASILVAPSIEDGFCHVVVEGLACGLPVITTCNTGAADYIRDGYNGYVVPIASAEAIAGKLLAVYRDRALLRSLREGALATIPVIGTSADRAPEYAELYRALAPPIS